MSNYNFVKYRIGQLCYSLFGKKVLDFKEDRTAENFFECVIKVEDKRVHVLLNGQYPFMAFTSTRESNVHYFPFINEPELSKIFGHHYKILSFNQLNEPLRYTQKGKKIIVKMKTPYTKMNWNNLFIGNLKQ